MSKTLFTEHGSPEADGSRVREFARIERAEADASTDPKVMTMTRSSGAEPGQGIGRLTAVARRTAE